ncbi:hypothetical protein bAD24_III04970 [Burkholderia sp. AD24]|nr:hypothetical protein bAD24_III04970 [Burkholderia sp. AD24]
MPIRLARAPLLEEALPFGRGGDDRLPEPHRKRIPISQSARPATGANPQYETSCKPSGYALQRLLWLCRRSPPGRSPATAQHARIEPQTAPAVIRRYAIRLQRIALSQQRKRSGHATSAADSAAQRSPEAPAKTVCPSCAGSESTDAPPKSLTLAPAQDTERRGLQRGGAQGSRENSPENSHL